MPHLFTSGTEQNRFGDSGGSVFLWSAMAIADLMVLGVIVGSNNLAVSFALGAMNTGKYHARILVTFGLFEFFVPLAGLLIGRYFSQLIESYATALGAALLMALGLFAVGKSLMARDQSQQLSRQITSYRGIFWLALGVSLDNLIVGFSLGLKDVPALLLAGVIAFFSVCFAFVGLKAGRYLSRRSRTITEVSAGVLLIMLAVAIYLGWF
ncbi:MAG: hypothetical protein EA392_10595 [Cryomorphaceae bacterium]|nr:MAG: hypothetical protein EA392_10595 [Cryomorphaceae bacterium]